MTRELCYVRGRTRLWHVVGASIAALFWLVPSVRAIAHGLDHSLEQTCNRLAMSCFSDRLGYDRAKKQLEQRLETQTDGQSMPVWEAAEASVGMGPRYQRRSRRKDPQYDRVFWSLVQVTVVVFILTGTTLQQLEVFDGEEVELSERWFFSYERSADYSDKKIESTRKRRW